MSNTGHICVVKRCTVTSKSAKDENISLFSFPKDPERCVQWANAAQCKHLLNQESQIRSTYYRVCARHFEDKMFLNDLQNRLQPTAVPILHLQEGLGAGSALKSLRRRLFEDSPIQHKGNEETVQPPDISSLLLDHDYAMKGQKCIASTSTGIALGEHCSGISIEIPQDKEAMLSPRMSHVTTQTAKILSSSTPRKTKLKNKVKNLRRKCAQLQKKVESLEKLNSQNLRENASVEDFKYLCEKMLPKSCVELIKLQAELNKK